MKNDRIADGICKNELMPLYYQIGNMLKERIIAGELPPGSKLPAENILARQYGVAKLTLRNALSKLSNEGYIRRLKGKGTFVAESISGREKIVSIIFDFPDQIMPATMARILSGIIMRLNQEKNYRIRLDSAETLPQVVVSHRNGEIRIDGIVAVRLNERKYNLRPLLSGVDIPFVTEGFTGLFNSVEIDNRESMKIIFNHLLELGHRDIGIGTIAATENAHIIQREEMVRQLLTKEFGGVNEKYCFNLRQDSAKSPTAKQALSFLRRKRKPTALLCTCDIAALPIITQAPFAGVSIPGELSVTGFDDMDACQFVYPQLTTIRQDYFRHGVAAAELLLDKINDCDHRKRHCRIVPELIIRGSCGRPNSHHEK